MVNVGLGRDKEAEIPVEREMWNGPGHCSPDASCPPGTQFPELSNR